MKKKVLLTSITTIILCVSIITGATFALFTDDTKFDISVTSADVEIEAYATINSVWSAYGEGVTKAEDEYLTDENGHVYAHGKRDPIDGRYFFTNGGEAVLDGSNLVIHRITPGDRVDIDINVTNKSDVAIAYRYKIEAKDTNLAKGMVVTVDGVSYEALSTWTSEWYPVIPAPEGKGETIPVKTFSVELPVYAGNEYQSEKEPQEDGRSGAQTVTYTVKVEAVQGNAVTDNEYLATIFQDGFQKMMNEREFVTAHGGTLELEECLELVYHDTTIVDAIIKGEKADAGAAIVPLLVYEGDLTLGEGTTVTSGDYGVFVMEGDKLTLDKGSKLVVNDGTIAAINVQSISDFELYLNDTGLIVDEAGNVADTRIAVLCGGTFKIYVPNVEAYAEYSKMIDTDSTHKTIEWYIDGKPVATDAAGFKAAIENPNVSYVYIGEDVADTITVDYDVTNKIIDANGNDVRFAFNGKLENVVITGIVADKPGCSINLKGANASGDLRVVDSKFISASGKHAGAAIGLGGKVNVSIDNCTFSSNGADYGISHSGSSAGLEITNSTFEGFSSWAILINNKVEGDVLIDKCIFNTPDGVFKTLGGGITGNFTFTNNTMNGCYGHDGDEQNPKLNSIVVSGSGPVVCGGTKTVTGNTRNGASWEQ